MKRVVLFAMVLMLGVISVQAQWSVVPEAGMTVMKAGPMVDWKPSWKIGVGVEYQLKPEFLSLKSGLYYTQRGYSNNTHIHIREICHYYIPFEIGRASCRERV